MLIIQIDNFKKRGVQNIHPALLLNRRGDLRLNSAAQTLCKLDIDQFIHFYQDGVKLYIKMDKDKTHGLKLRYDAKKKLCIAQSSNVVNHLVDIYDLVIPEKGSLSLNIIDADFGKYEVLFDNIKDEL